MSDHDLVFLIVLVSQLAVVGAAIPMVLGKVPPNRTYGMRVPETMASTEVWYVGNRWAGIGLLISSAIALVGIAITRHLVDDVAVAGGFYAAATTVPLLTATLIVWGMIQRYSKRVG